MRTQSTTRVVVAGAIGNVVEWYDFGLYGLLAPVLASVFFPSHDRIAGLLGVYGGFAVGFAVRPLGAIVLGRVGDRQGRQFVLVLSVVLMGAATVAVGLLPSYEAVGIWAPVLLIAIRLFQGFSVGGEFVGSVTYLVEAAAPNRRGIAGSVANVGATIGMLMAAGAAALAESNAHAAWAWRVPFFFGGALALAGYLLRRHMPRDRAELFVAEEIALEKSAKKITSVAEQASGKHDVLKGHDFSSAAEQASEKLDVLKGHDFSRAVTSPKAIGPLGPEGHFSKLLRRYTRFSATHKAGIQSVPVPARIHPRPSKAGFLARWPALDAFRRAPRAMIVALIFCCGYGVSNYVIMVFLPTFAHEFAGIGDAAALKINTAGQALVLLIAPLAGWASDRWLRRRTLLALAFAAQAGVAWECFRWTAHAGTAGLWTAQLLLAALLAVVMGAAPAMLAEQFARGYRVSAHAFVLNVGVGIAGGTAPMVAVALIRAAHSRMAPAWYLAAACAASAVAAMLLADRSREALNAGETVRTSRASSAAADETQDIQY